LLRGSEHIFVRDAFEMRDETGSAIEQIGGVIEFEDQAHLAENGLVDHLLAWGHVAGSPPEHVRRDLVGGILKMPSCSLDGVSTPW